MSVSAHLTPEPERRLWLILDSVRREAERAETKIGALAAFAAAELAYLRFPSPPDRPPYAAYAALSAALLLGVFAFAPLSRRPRWLPLVEPSKGRPNASDCMVLSDDIAKYPLGDLILRLDRYLGGGITATLYYEDLVAQILAHARAAARKKRLLGMICGLVGLAQLALVAR